MRWLTILLASTVLTYAGRYYDADVGFFTSVDPAGQFYNAYSYSPNPIRHIDPTGYYFDEATVTPEAEQAMMDITLMGSDADFNLLLEAIQSPVLIQFEASNLPGAVGAEFRGTSTGLTCTIKYTQGGLQFGGLLHELVHFEHYVTGVERFSGYGLENPSIFQHELPAYERQAAFIRRNNLYGQMSPQMQEAFGPLIFSKSYQRLNSALHIKYRLGYEGYTLP